MKKLMTLTFALFLTAGIAFGQNTATTTTTGNDNTAEVNQTANDGENEATVDQDGDDNFAKVEQIHTSSPVGTNPENVAGVTQDGDDNTVELLSTVGTSNEYYITQTGDDNKVESHANQGTNSAPSFSGDIDVLQEGNRNNVWDMDQHGYENLLEVDQLGNDNVANVEAQVSTANGFNAGDNEIFITQNGDDNKVGDNSSNGAGAYQEGVGNLMDIDQDGGASAGETSYEPINYNDPNDGLLDYDETFSRIAAEEGQGLIQRGDENNLTINQGSGGDNVVSFASQRGNLNEINVQQASGGDNTASAIQIGDEETSIFDQGSGTNVASSLQRGFGNMSTITQMDGTNNAAVEQFGDNTSTITQGGGTNTAMTTQTGNGNVSTTTQN